MTKKIILIIILSCIFFGFKSNTEFFNNNSTLDEYPTPTDKNMVFYIQKSFNTNAVVYTANIGKDGKLDANEPIKYFWRRYQENGEIKELKFLEKQFAFGINVKKIKSKENAYVFTLVSLKDMKLYLTQNKNGEPIVSTIIAGKPALLKRVFVTAEHVSLLPKVFYIEIYGKDLKTGELLYQKIEN